jgi:hypothetical protein
VNETRRRGAPHIQLRGAACSRKPGIDSNRSYLFAKYASKNSVHDGSRGEGKLPAISMTELYVQRTFDVRNNQPGNNNFRYRDCRLQPLTVVAQKMLEN